MRCKRCNGNMMNVADEEVSIPFYKCDGCGYEMIEKNVFYDRMNSAS